MILKEFIRRWIKKMVIAGMCNDIAEYQEIISNLSNQIEKCYRYIEDLTEKTHCHQRNTQQHFSELTENYLPEMLWNVILEHPHISAKFFPYKGNDSFYEILKKSHHIDMLTDQMLLPVPPKTLWEGYAETEEMYLDTGRKHISTMLEILSRDDFQIQHGFKVMEFGCAAARMLRWLADKASDGEFWGVDICADHIIWCQQHLSPPFYFFTTTTEPHLPFPDGYFDLIYAGSVFSHISELADFWFLELRRILRSGGRLYVTIHDRNTIDRLFETNPSFFLAKELRKVDQETDILSKPFDMFSFAMFSDGDKRNPKGAMVFYDDEYLIKKLRSFFDVKSVTPEAYGLQTAFLLEKL